MSGRSAMFRDRLVRRARAAAPLALVVWMTSLAVAAAPGDAAGPERCAASAERSVVGAVSAVSGSAWVESPACETPRRALRCGEALRNGDHLLTAPGARVAVLVDDATAQVEAESEIRVGLGEAGVADVALIRGSMRWVDRRPDESAPPDRLAKPGEWSEPIQVARLGAAVATGPAIAPPGECAVARPHVAIYTTPGQSSRGAGTETPKSDLGNVLGNSSDRFTPDDVAASDTFSPPPPSSPEPPASCPSPPCVQIGPPSGPPAGGGVAGPAVPGVVESPPVSRPPPGLPGRPRP